MLLAFLFSSNEFGRAASQGWGNTGAPGDETLSNGSSRTCVSCHSGGNMQVSLDIQVRNQNGSLVDVYSPGEILNVEVIVNPISGPLPAGYGVQLIPLFNNNQEVSFSMFNISQNAKLSLASNTGRTYFEQNGTSNSGTFTFSWSPPAPGSGEITFYASGVAVNGNGGTGGDGAATSTFKLKDATNLEIAFSAKVFLQGPYDIRTGRMNDNLRANNLIPLKEPYSDLGFTHTHGGGEVLDQSLLSISGNDAIVDWLFIKVLSANNPQNVIATKSVLLQADGDIVDHLGNPKINMGVVASEPVHVGVYHRNHLPVFTGEAIDIEPNIEIDFTNPNTSTFGTNATFNNGSQMLMWAGDSNGDNRIIYAGFGTDVNPISNLVFTNPSNPQFSPSIPMEGYETADLNLDGQITYAGFGTDINIISSSIFQNVNNTGFSPSFVLEAQIVE